MRRNKKLLMLFSTALLALAFAVPASASAGYNNWTFTGEKSFEPFEDFEGRFTVAEITAGPLAGSSLHCDAAFTVEAQLAGAKGRISAFEFDMETCEGVGRWANCVGDSYKEDISGTPIDMGATPTSFGGGGEGASYEVKLKSQGGTCIADSDYASFYEGEMIPTLSETGRVLSFELVGFDGGGAWPLGTFGATGNVEAGELGLEE